jgi:hypothetical protein
MTSVSHDNFSTAETYSARSAPWSQEAEQAVLGAMLLDQDAALRAAELVDDSMFYREAHRRLFGMSCCAGESWTQPGAWSISRSW